MAWKPLIPAIIGGLIVAIGWVVSHYLNKSRDIVAEKRKIRVTFLIEAYRRLESVGNRSLHQGHQRITDFESALADIQLLGTPEQIRLAQQFIVEFAASSPASLDPLLLDLRQTLRHELELEPVDRTLKFLTVADESAKQGSKDTGKHRRLR